MWTETLSQLSQCKKAYLLLHSKALNLDFLIDAFNFKMYKIFFWGCITSDPSRGAKAYQPMFHKILKQNRKKNG